MFFRKSSSTEIIDQPIQGQGTGYAFRDGQLFPITWSQSDPAQLFRLELPIGEDESIEQFIETGLSDAIRIEVISGLEEGQEILEKAVVEII